MRVSVRATTILLMAMGFVSACDQRGDDQPLRQSGVSVEGFSLGGIDPCDIALAPMVNDQTGGMTDVESNSNITRHQLAAKASTTPVPYLERVGWAFIRKARSEFDPGYYKLAEQTALCIESKQKNSSEGLLLRGHVLHSLHKFKEAETLAKKLVEQRGLWFDYGLLGDVLMEQGQLDQAIDAYQSMLDQRPGPQAYSRAAQMRWVKGDVAGAIEMMGLTLKAQGTRDKESIAWAHTRLAGYLVQTNDLRHANASLDKALQWQENYPPALLLRGRIQMTQGDSSAAINSLTLATERNTLPEYQWALIDALRMDGRLNSAHQVETRLSAKGEIEDPRTFSIYLSTIGKNTKLALRLAQQELKARADVMTLDAVAWAYHAVGNLVKAREFSKLSLLEGTMDARMLLHAAVIASASNEPKIALSLLNKVTDIKHMLLPSERSVYLKEFATIQSQISTSVTKQQERRIQPTI